MISLCRETFLITVFFILTGQEVVFWRHDDRAKHRTVEATTHAYTHGKCLFEWFSPLPLQRIKEGSVVDRVKVISVGDHVECINGRNIVGTRHYEVARMLKELPRDKAFTLKLVEPMKAFGERCTEQSSQKNKKNTTNVTFQHKGSLKTG